MNALPDASPTDGLAGLLLRQHALLRAAMDAIAWSPAAEAFAKLRRVLALHEATELEIIYPLLARAAPEVADALERRQAEEKTLELGIATLDELAPTSADFRRELERFRRHLDQHAAAEERTMFTVLRQLRSDGTDAALPAVAAPEVDLTHEDASFVDMIERARRLLRSSG